MVDPVLPEMRHRVLARLADPISGRLLGRPELGKRPPFAAVDPADRGTKTVIEDIMVEASLRS
jgi:hypothetical protein